MRRVTPSTGALRGSLPAATLLLGVLWAAPGEPEAPGPFRPPPSFTGLAAEVAHPVVNISTTQLLERDQAGNFRNFFGEDLLRRFFGDRPHPDVESHTLGSGLLIDARGHILTNEHVIEQASEIRVKLLSGREYAARVIARDPPTDLALLEVTPDEQLPRPAVLGDSESLAVGDWVIAVGNPFGLGHSVTVGILSAKGRVLGTGPYDDFLQTDAAINPGNSGGPLFDMQGRVIGINTAIVAQGQGIGFAIPSSLVRQLLPQLERGRVERGWLGVSIQTVTPALARAFGLEQARGVLVAGVEPGGPADEGGLRAGDIILRFGGQEVNESPALSREVASTPPGRRVPLDVQRQGAKLELEVTVGRMPGRTEPPQQPPPRQRQPRGWGLSVVELTPLLARRVGVPAGVRGVLIREVEPGSPAERGGLKPGDVVSSVDQQPVHNVRQYRAQLARREKPEPLLLRIHRRRAVFYAALELRE